MIQPEELRIGNWYLSTKFRVPVYCEISDFSQMEALAEGVRVDAEIVSQVFEPIPLNKEWLMCLGFEKHEDGFFEYYVIKYWNSIKTVESKIELSLENMGNYHIGIWIGADSVVHIYTVHQLQNLYRALTGKELTVKDSKKAK